ncbi:MAG: hypothetical protein IPP27_17770 [Bacteroidetes bacterium]|nr:hypothetical protein [Bacteroidota bacterium]MBL0033930.1 hypothetical protein [Bacteroidota bacterium]
MLDKFIKDKSDLISYSQAELSNIAASSNHLRGIISNQTDFNESFVGGSYKRATMVKGISDVDVYFQFTGLGNSQSALSRLRTCLINRYPNSVVKQDKPSILVDFERIPFNITPYKKDTWGNGISIPDNYLINWHSINFGELETAVSALRNKNPKYIDLIKILKLWNDNYNRGLKNFDIERRVCNLFVYSSSSSSSITDWLWTFFQNNGFNSDAQKIHTLMLITNELTLKSEWLKFIDKQ